MAQRTSLYQDIQENKLFAYTPEVFKMLLRDKTTRKNVIWGTDAYTDLGEGYGCRDEVTARKVTGFFGNIIKPRSAKTQEEQSDRVKDKAEVFTPSWVCNKQNNLIDDAWFGTSGNFNTEKEQGWITNTEPVCFAQSGKTWQDYVKENRIEITCGEAPYLASRYDTITGEIIPIKDRIGLLDRKLRIVSENVQAEPEWYKWAKRAIQSVYGFDWQGDNILLARENLLYTFMEHYENKFGVPAIKEYLKEIANVLSWNIWQMDGLKFVVPYSCHDEEVTEETLLGKETKKVSCEGCRTKDNSKHNGIYCRIYDWSAKRSIEFYSLIKGEK